MDRDQLEQNLREIITGCDRADGSCIDCHCTGNAAVYRAMIAIDAYTIALGLTPEELPGHELWDAAQVAEYTGQSSPAAARSWCSRNGVQRSTITRGNKALYPANHVRAAAVRILRKADA